MRVGFHKLQFRSFVEEVYKQVKAYVDTVEECKIERKQGYSRFFIETKKIPCSYGIHYDFTHHILTVTMDSIEMDQSLAIEKDVYLEILKACEWNLMIYKMDCFLLIQQEYVEDFSFLSSHTKQEIYGQEMFVRGGNPTELLALLDGKLSSPNDRNGYLPINQTPFDEGGMKVLYNFPQDKVELYYQPNWGVSHSWDPEYKLYTFQNEKDVEQYLEEVHQNIQEHQLFYDNLHQFVQSQHPDYYVKNEKVYLKDGCIPIRYKRTVIEDRIVYQVFGFCDEILLEEYKEVFPFIQRDFLRYQMIIKAKQDIMAYIQQEDEYSFSMTQDALHSHEWRFYSGVLDTKLSLIVTYDGAEAKYYVEMKQLGLGDSSFYRTETYYQRLFETIEEAVEFVKQHYFDLIKSRRLEQLFETTNRKHFRKLSYLFGIDDWREVIIQTGVYDDSKEVNDIISNAIDVHLQNHALVPYRRRKQQFEVIGSLYVYKRGKKLFISQDIDLLMDWIVKANV